MELSLKELESRIFVSISLTLILPNMEMNNLGKQKRRRIIRNLFTSPFLLLYPFSHNMNVSDLCVCVCVCVCVCLSVGLICMCECVSLCVYVGVSWCVCFEYI